MQQVAGGEHAAVTHGLHIKWLGRQQLEAMVVERQAEGVGLVQRQAPGQQARQPEVHVAAGERIHVEVLALPRLEGFHQQHARRGNVRQARLRLQHRSRRLQLGSGVLDELAGRIGALVTDRG